MVPFFTSGGVCHFVARTCWQVDRCVRAYISICPPRDGNTLVVSGGVYSWLFNYIYVSLCVHVLVFTFVLHYVGACVYAYVPVGVAREPQFLYGPICFVLFVLLINEIRGAACWDGPAAPLHWTGPLSHGLTLFSK